MMLGATGLAAVIAWVLMRTHLSLSAYAMQLILLNAAVLGICLLRRWSWVRISLWGWTILGLVPVVLDVDVWSGEASLARSEWIWVAFGLLMGDVLIRALWRVLTTVGFLDAALAAVATTGMYTATYLLLHDDYQPWMGTYTAALGIAAMILAWSLRRLPDHRKLAYGYLGQGLVLITLAIPVQFDHASVTMAWAIQGVVTMFLARRLRSKLLLIKSPIVLALGIIHYVTVELQTDPQITKVLLTPLGVEISYALVLAVVLTLSLLFATALLRAGKTLFSENAEVTLGSVLLVSAALLFAIITSQELPTDATTWWWFALAAVVGVAALWKRSEWSWVWAMLLLVVTLTKWMMDDTLYRRLEFGADTDVSVLMNWQMAAGVALSAAIATFAHFLGPRCLPDPSLARLRARIRTLLTLLAAIAFCWAGSFEIDRYFAFESSAQEWADPAQAVQMGYSLWWSLYAAIILVIGFLASRPSLRYLALVIFGVTLIKILLKDMAAVETIYRILALGGVGLIFLLGSFAYHRYFRSRMQDEVA